MAAELQEKIAEHEGRMKASFEWRTSDADLITQYGKNFADFKSQLGYYIQWHVKVISDQQGQLWNEMFETKLGIEVLNRTLRQA